MTKKENAYKDDGKLRDTYIDENTHVIDEQSASAPDLYSKDVKCQV